ncbi:MAG: MoaD/ThiS family protein [Methanoregula sp.]
MKMSAGIPLHWMISPRLYNTHFLAGLDTPLADGDLIALFPPAAGG